MAHPFAVQQTDGNPVLSTVNGSYYTEEMSADFENADVYLEFFSDAAGTVPVTPTAGTISVAGSPMGNVWLAPPWDQQDIVATDVSVGPTAAQYTPRHIKGMMSIGRVTFAGVAGAAYARVTFWRY